MPFSVANWLSEALVATFAHMPVEFLISVATITTIVTPMLVAPRTSDAIAASHFLSRQLAGGTKARIRGMRFTLLRVFVPGSATAAEHEIALGAVQCRQSRRNWQANLWMIRAARFTTVH
jgi:hypothetical protein